METLFLFPQSSRSSCLSNSSFSSLFSFWSCLFPLGEFQIGMETFCHCGPFAHPRMLKELGAVFGQHHPFQAFVVLALPLNLWLFFPQSPFSLPLVFPGISFLTTVPFTFRRNDMKVLWAFFLTIQTAMLLHKWSFQDFLASAVQEVDWLDVTLQLLESGRLLGSSSLVYVSLLERSQTQVGVKHLSPNACKLEQKNNLASVMKGVAF